MERGGARPGLQVDKADLDRLNARYRKPLMQYFLRRARDQQDAEDLVQEVFIRMIGRGAGEQLRSADSYVFTIASNLLRDRVRLAATHQDRAHDQLERVIEIGAVDGNLVEHLSPDRVLLARERLAEALQALNELGPRTRNIFVLYRMENMQRREIAGLYGISVSAVEKHIAKALDHLMTRLGR